MQLDLDKDNLIALVEGSSPNYSVMGLRLVKKHGNFNGSYGNWSWHSFGLEKCTKQELLEIYKICKDSWK
jgi:hypothetical protein